MRVALAQLDPVIGEVDRNLGQIRELIDQANADGADLTVFPELAVHGYALGRIRGGAQLRASDERLAALASGHSDVLVGFHEDGGVRAYNSAAYLSGGEIVHVHRKLYLPTYLAWEERKHMSPGQSLRAFETGYARTATLVCNDAWQPALPWLAAQDGAELMLVPTNSAANLGEDTLDNRVYWERLLESIGRMQQAWVVFVNRVGTEDGGEFWGGSRVVDPHGEVVVQAPYGEMALISVDIDIDFARRVRRELPLLAEARLGLIQRETARLIEEGGDA
ncbi:MAG TPA: nitrilase-related carbon-nitrogen hydrolase [Solirubrobacteraceae bacterium]|jgi:N-carbamoylputrescine amidase|nr:nitrilase-related carbon-nitrogen hydrolase [Solirubrobacteraceae bacterium]